MGSVISIIISVVAVIIAVAAIICVFVIPTSTSSGGSPGPQGPPGPPGSVSMNFDYGNQGLITQDIRLDNLSSNQFLYAQTDTPATYIELGPGWEPGVTLGISQGQLGAITTVCTLCSDGTSTCTNEFLNCPGSQPLYTTLDGVTPFFVELDPGRYTTYTNTPLNRIAYAASSTVA